MKKFRLLGGPIVIEGIDGSGKGEQFKLLVARLKNLGLPVETMDFPQYDSESSYFVRQHLNGVYGGLEISPEKASLFYAMDRFDVANKIVEFIKNRKILIFNRYTFSNLGHQGAKILDEKERHEFFKWLSNLEHNILGIPRAYLNIICDMPVLMAMHLINKKNEDSRRYLKHGTKKDIYEDDQRHLELARHTYLELVDFYKTESVVVKCVESGNLLSIEEIHEKIWEIVREELEI